MKRFIAISGMAALIGMTVTAALFLEPPPPKAPPPVDLPASVWTQNITLRTCVEAGERKRECGAYLSQLMSDVRFGTPVQSPFCIPDRELTDEERDAIFKRFRAENPSLDAFWAMQLSVVITVKAPRC